jgi:beta-RFAP synthase
MTDAPGIELTAEPARQWGAEGPSSDRVRQVAENVAARLENQGRSVTPARFRVLHAPRAHVGLGSGTQLGLAVARALCALSDEADPSLERLAQLSGRGLRSGIGLHGFARGGLIVDGGRRTADGVPPLLSRMEFPDDWSILVVVPGSGQGYHGPEEAHAFAKLPPIPERVTEHLCRLVLLGILPAVAERDIKTFGMALGELQEQVGRCFASAQGGTFARPESEEIVSLLRTEGLHGVGQSSWGPAIYGFRPQPEAKDSQLIKRLEDRFRGTGGIAFWTVANNIGATTDEGD